MANSNGWGDGAANNTIGWGQGANNAIGWGDIHADSWAGATDIVGVQAASLLLDTYTGAAVAYSLRKLRTEYTGAAIRVRRTDLAEQDIAFDSNGDLDTTALLSFVGTGALNNGFITTWYDQSGSANNSTQATAANQAQIVSAGTVITDPITNKISTIWSSDSYSITTSFAPVQQNTQIAVFNRTALTQRIINLGSSVSAPFIGYWNISDVVQTSYGSPFTHGTSAATGIFLQTVLRNSSNEVKAWHNNVAFPTVINSTVGNSFNFWARSSSITSSGYKQELIYWTSDQEANRIGIETDINTYWNAY
jgi:hypothetical protein